MPLPLATILDSAVRDVKEGMTYAIRAEWECAAANEAFYRRLNHLYFEHHGRREGESRRDLDLRPKQFSYMTYRAIRCLTDKLYCPGPERKYDNAAGDAYLQEIWSDTRFDALMQRLDQLATLNGVAAVQAVGTGDPKRPIKLYLWGRQEFQAYFNDDDLMAPVVLVTRSILPGSKRNTKRRQYEIWTEAQHLVYTTKDFTAESPDGTAADIKLVDEPNPYGVIPFAFVFNDLPVDRFESDGLGTALRTANEEIDRMLSDLADLLACYNRPQGFIRNVPLEWRYSEKAGRFTLLKSLPGAKAGDTNAQPDPFYLQPEVDTESTWAHITEYQNRVFEDLEIPIRAVRGNTYQSAESGISIVAQQAGITGYVKARQTAFGLYEHEIARMILAVAGNFYGDAGLTAAAEDGALEVVWREPQVDVPTPERMQALEYQVQSGIKSKIGLCMTFFGLTREGAIEYLEHVAEDYQTETEILGEMQEDEDDEQDDEAEPEPEPEDDGGE